MTTAAIPSTLFLQILQRLSAAALAAVLSFFAFAPSVGFGEPPTSVEEFDKRYAEEGKTPEGALKLWFDGIFLYHDKGTRPLGVHILTETTAEFAGASDWEGRSSAATFVTRMRNAADMQIFRSYAKGATPDNNYAIDLKSYELNIMSSGADQYSEEHAVRLISGGADNPRTVHMSQNPKTGLWRVQRFSSVYLGVRKPTK
jgi:hypothetical protein